VELLVVPEENLQQLLDPLEVVEAVEMAFREKGLGRVQMPPKTYLFFAKYNGDLRVMPAYLELRDVAGVKLVNVHPDNPERFGIPTVNAVIVLFDPRNGLPFALLGGTWITAMRTGAAGAVAAKYLARRDAQVLALIGAGVQARTQLACMVLVRRITEVRVWSRRAATRRRFIEEMAKAYPDIKFVDCETVEEALFGADIITTTTPSTRPLVRSEWVDRGVHINAIGADAPGKQELDPMILKRADKLVVDDFEQASHSGEINVPLNRGLLSPRDIYGELGEIVAGRKPGREHPNELTIFDSTGLAIQDVATACIAYRKARRLGIGLRISI